MNLVEFVTPQQYRMGTVGTEETPVYADCATCGAREAVIHGGFQGEDGQFGVIRRPDGFYSLALFCEACFAARLGAAGETEGQ